MGHPSEKYERQLGRLFPIYGKIKNIPKHQPVIQLRTIQNHYQLSVTYPLEHHQKRIIWEDEDHNKNTTGMVDPYIKSNKNIRHMF